MTPLPDPPHAAPALVTDFPPPRQLSIHIPRSVVVLLPLTGLALYLLVSLLPKSATPVEAASARTELAAPAQLPAPSAPAAADAPADGVSLPHDVATTNTGDPGRGAREGGEHLRGGRLAGAVGA